MIPASTTKFELVSSKPLNCVSASALPSLGGGLLFPSPRGGPLWRAREEALCPCTTQEEALCRVWEETLCVEPERRPCLPSPRGGPLSASNPRGGPVPSLRRDLLCWTWEEALFAEPERRPCLLSLRGGPLCMEEALCACMRSSVRMAPLCS